jgi:hypothetical protein
MKTSVNTAQFRGRLLSGSADPEALEGRAVLFDGSEDYHKRIEDPARGDAKNLRRRVTTSTLYRKPRGKRFSGT